jgi:Hormone-sensitive lipase (HSL) N-terminus
MESLVEQKAEPISLLLVSIENSANYFNKTEKFIDLKSKLEILKKSVKNCNENVKKIEAFAGDYDFDHKTPGNGYRSFIDVFNSAIKKSSKLCEQLISGRSKILFRAAHYAKYNVQCLISRNPVKMIVCFYFAVKSASGMKYFKTCQKSVRL